MRKANGRSSGSLKKYPPARKASAVIPMLYIVQRQMGRLTRSAWVPRVAMDVVAARLDVPPIRIYEVATFYFMFNMAPIGQLSTCRFVAPRRAGCAGRMRSHGPAAMRRG